VYGQPKAAAEEAIEAARAAQAHEFILRKPLAYDTWLGERGAGLSGGEKQRISIARALLYDPKVLILDEATSSIDTESEREIQEALRELTRGRTTLAIAHRLSTLRDCDRIFVLDQGRLVEQGTHDALMRLDGQYARLVKIQTQIARNMSIQPTLDGAAGGILENSDGESMSPGSVGQPFTADVGPRWLTPGTATFRNSPQGMLEATLDDGGIYRGVTAINCFPATQPNDFISLRVCDRDGREHELGILRQLDEWPQLDKDLVRHALSRSYFLRCISRIDEIKLDAGHLNFLVETDHGPARFTMRWNQNQAQDYGQVGKVLVDLDDNRFLIPDVNALSPRSRELLGRFIY
jgi:hypothetical protein